MKNYPIIRKTLLFSPIFVLIIMCAMPMLAIAAPLVPCGLESYSKAEADSYNSTNAVEIDEGQMTRIYEGSVKDPCDFGDFITLVNNITNFLIILGASFSAVAFGYAGFLMMTANGEMGKIEEAKAIFGKVVVGFLLMLSAWLIVHALEAAFLDETEFDSFLS